MRFKSKPIKTAGVAAAAAALMIGGSGAAFAASSYDLSAGSAPAGSHPTWSAHTTGSTPQVTFTDVDALGGLGVTLHCQSATAAGSVTVGNNQPGHHIGEITSTNWQTCTGPFNTSFTVQGNGTWYLNATGNTDANGSTPGTITGVSADVSGSCSFTVTNYEPLDATWTNGNPSGTLDVPGTDAQLVLSNVSGPSCGLLGISNGDHATFDATYAVTPDDSASTPITLTSNP